ncbi:carbohydrate ABC transporter permease [Reyranella sp. CPCC 100927]|uniref:carbohydrate ABC transporter permease n=1 Tax=Reyranella sp. CPCC 100927 TaxID=2599616 RepID=UPI0011B55187|nr:sugar ABC transporter permease [Reyranella sp. CPCC 100927]TWT10246.1 sugar ABC transporter permease [Reyranella sp. CPCC 100927]
MVSLSNHEGIARASVQTASWFDRLTMKRFSSRRSPLIWWLMAAPAVLLCLGFVWLPMAATFGLSVVDVNVLRGMAVWRGLAHYGDTLANPDFHLALKNTAIYLAVLLPLQILVPLLLAYALMHLAGRVVSLYRGALFLPAVLSFPIAAVVWLWLFNPVVGVLNAVLTALGGMPQRWLNDPDMAIYAVCAVSFWKCFGLNLPIFAAALANVPPELRQAAALDGAGPWRRAWHVELPMISPTLFFAGVTTLLLVLDEIVGAVDVLTEGGPFKTSTNLLYFLYERAFRHFQFGEAAAVATLIMGLVAAATWLQFRMFERRVHYA